MNYSMGSGIIRYIRAPKTFSKFHALRSSVRFEVPCASKFSALRSSVCFEVPCASKFRALRSSVWEPVHTPAYQYTMILVLTNAIKVSVVLSTRS